MGADADRPFKAHCSEKKPRLDRYGAAIGWGAAPDVLTPFHTRIFDILGIVGGGIYNCPISWSTVYWDSRDHLSLTWNGALATFDNQRLTFLVFLCHEARVKCVIEAAGRNYLRLSFWQRQAFGDTSTRHPNLSEAVKAFCEYMPRRHRILYGETTNEDEETA